MSDLTERENQFLRAKEALLSSYNSKQTNQGARLVGFMVALFALLQTIQGVTKNHISEIFPSMESSMLQNLALPIDLLRLFILFGGVVVLTTLIIYSLLRFSVHAQFSQDLLLIKQCEIADRVNKGISIHSAIESVVWQNAKKRNVRVFGIFRLNWFVPTEEEHGNPKGWISSSAMGIVLTLLLAFIIW